VCTIALGDRAALALIQVLLGLILDLDMVSTGFVANAPDLLCQTYFVINALRWPVPLAKVELNRFNNFQL